MSRRNQRLIDRISHYSPLGGDPTDAEALLAYFNETGEIYDALAVSGDSPEWSRQFIEADEHLRIAQFATLASAAAALITYKKPGVAIHKMTVLELANALRRILRKESPARFRRINTGRGNKQLDEGLNELLEQAYKDLSGDNSLGRPPGWVMLQRRAQRLHSAYDGPFRDLPRPTEHHVKTFLKSKK